MRPALGSWNQGSELYRLNRERDQFCGISLSFNIPVGCTLLTLLSILGYDNAFHNRWLCGRLRDLWQVAAFGSDADMLGGTVCNHESDV